MSAEKRAKNLAFQTLGTTLARDGKQTTIGHDCTIVTCPAYVT